MPMTGTDAFSVKPSTQGVSITRGAPIPAAYRQHSIHILRNDPQVVSGTPMPHHSPQRGKTKFTLRRVSAKVKNGMK